MDMYLTIDELHKKYYPDHSIIKSFTDWLRPNLDKGYSRTFSEISDRLNHDINNIDLNDLYCLQGILDGEYSFLKESLSRNKEVMMSFAFSGVIMIVFNVWFLSLLGFGCLFYSAYRKHKFYPVYTKAMILNQMVHSFRSLLSIREKTKDQ